MVITCRTAVPPGLKAACNFPEIDRPPYLADRLDHFNRRHPIETVFDVAVVLQAQIDFSSAAPRNDDVAGELER